MAASVTLAFSGNWTDFSTPTDKDISPGVAIPVGHRAVFCYGSTVDRGVQPDATNFSGIRAMTDSVGNVWTRDSTGPIDATDSGTTCEIWSCVVTTQIPTTGYTIHVTPDTNGISTNWFLLDLDPGGVISWPDLKANAAHSGFNQNISTGLTDRPVKMIDEVIIGVGASGAASGVFTAPAGYTKVGEYSGSGSGSAIATCVVYKVVSAAPVSGYGGTIVTTSNTSLGMGCVATYAIGTPTVGGMDKSKHPNVQLRTAA